MPPSALRSTLTRVNLPVCRATKKQMQYSIKTRASDRVDDDVDPCVEPAGQPNQRERTHGPVDRTGPVQNPFRSWVIRIWRVGASCVRSRGSKSHESGGVQRLTSRARSGKAGEGRVGSGNVRKASNERVRPHLLSSSLQHCLRFFFSSSLSLFVAQSRDGAADTHYFSPLRRRCMPSVVSPQQGSALSPIVDPC